VVTVAIVEDNDVFREALEILLGLDPELEVVVSAPDGRTAIAACAERRPDVALVDYRLPDVDGAETTRGIRAASPETTVLGLTAAADGPYVTALRDAGAVACLIKDRELADIVAAVRDAGGRAAAR
jgi:DNA-binding NarL/FixJ family response regulator